MPTPRKNLSQPVPNEPFNSPEITAIRGPYWNMPLGEGLEADPYGSVQTTGSEPSEPQSVLYGPNGWVGVGSGLEISPEGNLGVSAPPCDFPPYNCSTDINTSCVEDFFLAWYNCSNLTSLPETLDLSSGVYFFGAWYNCSSLTSFPLLNVSSGQDFSFSWSGCSSLTFFPELDVSSGTMFGASWAHCSNLNSFPSLNVNSGTIFNGAWRDCTSLTSFPAEMFDSCTSTLFTNAWYNCALSQQSVDNILVSLDTAGQHGGIVNIDGGTSASPGAAGLTAKANLQAKGWTVLTN